MATVVSRLGACLFPAGTISGGRRVASVLEETFPVARGTLDSYGLLYTPPSN